LAHYETPPPKDRGKRLRISGIPLEACYDTVEAEIKKAIPSTTEILLETVKDFPTVRTSYATFWAKEPPTTPSTIIFQGKKARIFDPEEKKRNKKAKYSAPKPDLKPGSNSESNIDTNSAEDQTEDESESSDEESTPSTPAGHPNPKNQMKRTLEDRSPQAMSENKRSHIVLPLNYDGMIASILSDCPKTKTILVYSFDQGKNRRPDLPRDGHHQPSNWLHIQKLYPELDRRKSIPGNLLPCI
jgi:hypothetical protein